MPKTSVRSSANMTCHHLFADDKQCLCSGKPAEVPYMITRIENCIAHICTWCAAKRLQLNADKTEILWFGSAANLRKLSADELNIRVGQLHCQTSHYSPESWCSHQCSYRCATSGDHVSRLVQTCFFSLTPSTLSASSARPRCHGTIGLHSRTVTTRLL